MHLRYTIKYEEIKESKFYFNDYTVQRDKLILLRETMETLYSMEIDDVRDINQKYLTPTEYEEIKEVVEANDEEGLNIYREVLGVDKVKHALEVFNEDETYESYLGTLFVELVAPEVMSDKMSDFDILVETDLY